MGSLIVKQLYHYTQNTSINLKHQGNNIVVWYCMHIVIDLLASNIFEIFMNQYSIIVIEINDTNVKSFIRITQVCGGIKQYYLVCWRGWRLTNKCSLTSRLKKIDCFVDADHGWDKATRRSQTGIILFENSAPLVWYSKRQNMVESSTFAWRRSCRIKDHHRND